MKLIPAIDIKNGKVVLPQGGNRDNYKEISTIFSIPSDPVKFIDYLHSLYHFNTIYIADLDSIRDFISDNIVINEITETFKKTNFLIDNGVVKQQEINNFSKINCTQIIATETFNDYRYLIDNKINNYILSLDFKNKEVLCKNSDFKILKPKKVICMNMDNIGKKNGVNFENIKETRMYFPESEIIFSGGIKNHKDILQLSKNNFNEIMLMTAIIENKILYDEL
jgi:HisA/HisF family protein